jgi:manganese transport protein
MAEADVITGFLGKPADPRTTFYRVAVFVTAIPALLVILFSLDTYRILIFSQVILSLQLPFTLVPLLMLCRNRKVMGSFRSGNAEFVVAALISALVIALNSYFFYTTMTGGG